LLIRIVLLSRQFVIHIMGCKNVLCQWMSRILMLGAIAPTAPPLATPLPRP